TIARPAARGIAFVFRLRGLFSKRGGAPVRVRLAGASSRRIGGRARGAHTADPGAFPRPSWCCGARVLSASRAGDKNPSQDCPSLSLRHFVKELADPLRLLADALFQLVLLFTCLVAPLEQLIGDVERGQDRERMCRKRACRSLHLRDLVVHERGERVEVLLAGLSTQGQLLPGDLDRHGALHVPGRSWTPAQVMSTCTMVLQN